MRILHYCTDFSLLTETFIYDTITELERQGVDNHIVTRQRSNDAQRPFPKVHILRGIGQTHPAKLLHRACRMFVPRARRSCLNEFIPPQLLRLTHDLRPDFLHAHFGLAARTLAPLARRTGIPMVVSFYGHDISKLPLIPAWRRHYEDMTRVVRAASVLSSDMKEKAISLGFSPEIVHVIHLSRLVGDAEPPLPCRPVRRLVSIGRLVEKKGHETAIRAFASLASRFPDARMEIIGDGPLHNQLLALIRELGVAGKVQLAGPLPNPETMQRLAEADAFILCSQTAANGDEEGTPTVLVEAQQRGKPCVSTLHAGIPEMVPETNRWLLAPEKDFQAVADRLHTLFMLEPQSIQTLCDAGYMYVRREFDLTTETRKLVRLYEQLAVETSTR